MHKFLLYFILIIFDSARDLNKQGNKLYHKEKYKEALEKYKEAQVKAPNLMIMDYNIGCGQYKTQSYNEGGQSFKRIISSLEDKDLKHKSFYNLGNVLFKLGELEGAIEMFKHALKLNPSDMDAKINLEFAQKLLKEGQQPQQPDSTIQKEQQKNGQNKSDQEQKLSQEAAKSLLEVLQQDEKSAKEKSQKSTRKGRIAILKDW